MRSDPATRFFAKFIVKGDCWLWTAGCYPNGYGKFWDGERQTGAHQFSYVYHFGPVPVGLELDHLCRTRNCVNPRHMEPVTRRENLLRSPITGPGVNAQKTHCPRGHPLSGENLYLWRGKKRLCRTCRRKQAARFQREKRQGRKR